MLISMEEYYEGGHSVCRNPVIQKMFVFMGFGEKSGTGADVIAKGWKDNEWLRKRIILIESRHGLSWETTRMLLRNFLRFLWKKRKIESLQIMGTLWRHV